MSDTASRKLRVLFVSSGNNSKFSVAPFIRSQGESLAGAGVEVDFFAIKGSVLGGYFSSIPSLRRKLAQGGYDVVHGHFVLSAWTVVLAMPRIPIVLSLMGSDAYGQIQANGKPSLPSRVLTLLTLLIQPFVSHIISKSPNIDRYVWRRSVSTILPNGVDMATFLPSSENSRSALHLDECKRYVLFLGNTQDPRKNHRLVAEAMGHLSTGNVELLTPYPQPHANVIRYMNAADVLVMCSLAEGSPNVVKESMACNLRAAVTDVGDTRYLVDGVAGYEIVPHDPKALAAAIDRLLASPRCDGRKRLSELRLSTPEVAQRLREVYERVAGK